MNAKMERIEKNIVKFEVKIDSEKFSEGIKKSYKKNASKYNLPGFRKGKAPMGVIKRYYGNNVFFEDAVNLCIDETYPEVIKEYEINPVDYPEIDVVQVEEGKELIYTAKVTVRPEVELGLYKGVEVKKVEYAVTEDEIGKSLKTMQEKNSRVEAKVDGAVEKNNIAVIDYKGFVDGVAFEGGESKDFPLEIGSGSFIDNFEDQLIGLKVQESKEVNVKFPDEYSSEALKGKAAVFQVTVKEIKVKEVPELDDEFAKEASEFDTIDELKADLRKKMESSNEEKTKREFEEAVIDTVCDNVTVEIPKAMIDKEIDFMLKDLENRLKPQGLDLKTYYQYANTDENKVKEQMKENAEKRVKTELVIDAVAKAEKIEATSEELLAKANEYAKQYGDKDLEKAAQQLIDTQKKYLELEIVNEKVIDLLVVNSKAIA